MNARTIGIIGAMEEEVRLLRSRFSESRTEQRGTFKYHRGSIDDKEVVLLQCGIGKVNAAAGAAILLERYRPGIVINTGTAGGVNPPKAFENERLSVGDIVLAEKLVYHDVDVTSFGYSLGQIPGQKLFFEPSLPLIRTAETAIRSLRKNGVLPKEMKSLCGIVASGDIFMANSQRIARTAREFPGVRAVEMESAAIAHVCTLYNTPFLVIRALSDVAGESSPVSFEEYLPLAARHSSEIVVKVLSLADSLGSGI